MNRKGVSPLTYLIGIIVSLLGFFIFFTVMISTSNTVTSEVEEKTCETYLKARSTGTGELTDFFIGLADTCKVGTLESDTTQKEEVFREVSQRINSCWERYGSGEIDFMSNYDTTGEYCFPCTKILYEEEFSYDYDEYINWVQENGPQGSNKTYSELINFQYFSEEENNLQDIESSLKELQGEIRQFNEDDGSSLLADISLYINDYRNDLVSLRDKRITSGESYVVFKYKRVNNTLTQTLKNTVESGAYGAAGSFVTGTGVRMLIGGPIGLASSVIRVGELARRANKLERVSEKTVSIMRILKNTKKSTLAIGAATAAGGAAGGAVGNEMNYNYDQYVDIVDEEEYYRTCGPTPVVE